MKCEIPSFVADFVTVNSWIDNTGSEYFAEIDLNYGNVVVKDYLITMHKPKILYKNGSLHKHLPRSSVSHPLTIKNIYYKTLICCQ